MSEFQLFISQNLEDFKTRSIKYPDDPKMIQALGKKLEEYNKRTFDVYQHRPPEKSWHHFAKVFILQNLLTSKSDINELDIYERFKSEMGEQIFDFNKDEEVWPFMERFHANFNIIKTYAEDAGRGLWNGTGLDMS